MQHPQCSLLCPIQQERDTKEMESDLPGLHVLRKSLNLQLLNAGLSYLSQFDIFVHISSSDSLKNA